MKKLFLLTASLLILQNLFSQERHITVDSAKIWVNTIGLENRKAGQPVVIFENGHGVPMGNWDKVLSGVSEIAPLVTYDRPGVGKSEAINEIPNIKNVSDRLVRILTHLEIDPPYLLVGHSLGGLYVRGFSIHYPELLAGLIIVDPADFTENHTNKRAYYDVLEWKNTRVDSLIQSFTDRRKKSHAKAAPPIRREGEYLEEIRDRAFKEIAENTLPNIPVHIIMGGRFDMPAKFHSNKYDEELLFRSKMKHRANRWMEVVQSVEKGMFFYSSQAGHYIQWDAPSLVISSIKLAIEDYYLLRKGK